LPRIGISFPVAAEVALAWNELEWRDDLLQFSGQFTDQELDRVGQVITVLRG
jgi:hypothetical protein